MGIFDKFKLGFKKSASALTSGIKEIIIKKEIDDENLNKIEEFLIQSDVGVEAASEIKEIISTKKIDPKKDLSNEINIILKEYIISLMKPLENNSFFEKKGVIKSHGNFSQEAILMLVLKYLASLNRGYHILVQSQKLETLEAQLMALTSKFELDEDIKKKMEIVTLNYWINRLKIVRFENSDIYNHISLKLKHEKTYFPYPFAFCFFCLLSREYKIPKTITRNFRLS